MAIAKPTIRTPLRPPRYGGNPGRESCLGGAAVALPFAHGLRAALLTFIVVTGWLFKQRRWLSDEGSDQMGQASRRNARLETVIDEMVASASGR